MPETAPATHIADNSLGVRLRREYLPQVLENRPAIDWLELITDGYLDASKETLEKLARLRRDYPMLLHGLSLSIGSPWPLNQDYLKRTAELARQLQPLWISDHLCWSGADDLQGSLMPLPFSQEMLEHLVPRIDQAQETLGRPLVLENVPTGSGFEGDIPEPEFLAEVAQRSGCELLIDLSSLRSSCIAGGYQPADYLDRLPVERVRQFHLCGATFFCGNCLQSDADAEPDPIWLLYREVSARIGPRPTLIEREDSIPSLDELLGDLQQTRCALEPDARS